MINLNRSGSGTGNHKSEAEINDILAANNRQVPAHVDQDDAFEDEEVDVDDLPESMKPKLETSMF